MSVAKPGSVASMINNFHKMEYESGRMEQPVSKKSKQDLKSDHPAQKPKIDETRPVNERPQLRHQPSVARTPSPRMVLEQVDLRHRTASPSDFESNRTHEFPISILHYDHHKQDSLSDRSQCSPFPRRNSNTSNISSTTHPQHRESVSHRAFERVRTASPPISMPVPRIDITPWHETAEQYITRKLTERWSPPSSQIASVSAHSGLRRGSGGAGRSHIDAEDVQDVLGSIEEILNEHTRALESVIDNSRKMLRERELVCYNDDDDDDDTKGIDDVEGWRSQNSSVPDLISAVDRTANHLGITLPEYLGERQAKAAKEVRALTPISPKQVSGASSPLWSEEDLQDQERKCMKHEVPSSQRTDATLRPHIHRNRELSTIYSETDPQSDTSTDYAHHHHAPPPSPLNSQSSLRCHRHHAIKTYPRRDDQSSSSLEQFPVSTPSPHSHQHLQSYTSIQASAETHHNVSPNPFWGHSGSTPPIYQSFWRTRLASPSPSPALVEYDRFAALADRATRNSIAEIPDLRRTSLQSQPHQSFPAVVMGTGIDVISDNATPAPAAALAAEREVNVGETWMQKQTSAASAEQGKLKRAGTMDKLKEKAGYERAGRKKLKQLPAEPEGEEQTTVVQKIRKRETGMMMDSILTREGRDREKMRFGDGSGRK